MRKFGFILLIVVFVLIAIIEGCGSHQMDYFFKADQIKDHPSPDQIEAIMNTKPDTSFYRLFFGKTIFIQLYYLADSVEFRFKDEKMIEAIIHKPTLECTPESITKFGLKYIEPAEQDTTAFFRWIKQYDGFDAINFYKVGSKKRGSKINYKIYFRLAQ